jgi:HAAS
VKADAYLSRVDAALRDLPWRMRRELMSEVRGHLSELPSDVAARLGTPEQYVADLRVSAGLERRRGVIAFLRARRPRNLILIVLALTVTGLAIGAAVWIDSYQPLAAGNSSQFPAGAKGEPGLNGESVVFHKGRPFQFGITVVNNRRFTVRVLGVPYVPPLPWTARLMMSPTAKNTGRIRQPYMPFHPFDLKPGDVVFLFFKGVYACNTGRAAGTTTTFDDFPVRYRFLWRTATTNIPLPESLAFSFPKGCPPPRTGSATP